MPPSHRLLIQAQSEGSNKGRCVAQQRGYLLGFRRPMGISSDSRRIEGESLAVLLMEALSPSSICSVGAGRGDEGKNFLKFSRSGLISLYISTCFQPLSRSALIALQWLR